MKEDILAFSIGCAISALIQIFTLIKKQFKECDILDSTPVSQIKIPKYTKACLKWCSQTLGGNIPLVKFSQAQKPKDKDYHLGLYDFNSEIITLYTKRHDSILQLTNTIIHEYQHHIQKLNGVTFKKYSKFEYLSNPYEFECHKVAKRHEFTCAIESLQAMS